MKRESLEGLMISLEVAEESSFSAGTYRLSIRTAIRQAPFHKSIFLLLCMNILEPSAELSLQLNQSKIDSCIEGIGSEYSMA